MMRDKNKKYKGRRAIAIGNFIFLAIIFLACSGTAQSSTNTSTISMIDIVGLQYEEAIKKLEDAGATNISSNISDYQDVDNNKIVVVSQKPSAGMKIAEDEEIEIVCRKLCKLYLDIESENNLLFKKYDIDIYFDGEKIGTVANGELFTELIEVIDGSHIIEFRNAKKSSVTKTETINVNKDITFSALVSHGKKINFEKNVIKSGIAEAEIEMPNVEGKLLSRGEYVLEKSGFLNIFVKSNGKINNNDEWIISKQSIEAGDIIEKTEEIYLECISLEEYFQECCLGKSIKEIEEIAEEKEFNVKYLDKNHNLLFVIKVSEEEKDKFCAIEVERDTSTY